MRAADLDPSAYAHWFRSDLGRRVQADEGRALAHGLGDVSGFRVLDAGCGEGRLSRELARRGGRVVGLDRSPAMLSAARAGAGAHDGAWFVRGDVAALPFRDESFERVVAVTVLCFVPDPAATMSELAACRAP